MSTLTCQVIILSWINFFLLFQKSPDVLSNELQVRSLHASLWDGEAIFWSKCLLADFQSIRKKLRALFSPGRSGEAMETSKAAEVNRSRSVSSVVGGVLALPVSVVTTVEASDWSLQFRAESPSLQSKRPLVRGVMAACVGNVQWSHVEDHTSSLR